MKTATITILAMILATNGAIARSSLLESLQANIYEAQGTLRQEQRRFDNAKDSLKASEKKLKIAIKTFEDQKINELEEDRQARAIAKANAEYYEIPQYRRSANNTGLTYNQGRKR